MQFQIKKRHLLATAMLLAPILQGCGNPESGTVNTTVTAPTNPAELPKEALPEGITPEKLAEIKKRTEATPKLPPGVTLPPIPVPPGAPGAK